MLYPMQWQHIFLPLLPATLLDYLTAPMPFLVGVPAALVPAMKRQPMEEVVVLNLDTGVIECFADLGMMPRSYGRRLEAELQESLKSRVHNDSLIASALRSFFVATIGDYRRFVHYADKPGEAKTVIPQDALRSGGLWLDHAAFVASARSQSTQAFRGTLRHTQSFEAFITSRLDALAEGGEALRDDAFEKAVAEREQHAAMNKASDVAAAASERAAQVAKEKGKALWGGVLRLGERAAGALEGLVERAENTATAISQHPRNRSFDNLPSWGMSSSGAASPSSLRATVPRLSQLSLERTASDTAGPRPIGPDTPSSSCSDFNAENYDSGMTVASSQSVVVKPPPPARTSLDGPPPAADENGAAAQHPVQAALSLLAGGPEAARRVSLNQRTLLHEQQQQPPPQPPPPGPDLLGLSATADRAPSAEASPAAADPFALSSPAVKAGDLLGGPIDAFATNGAPQQPWDAFSPAAAPSIQQQSSNGGDFVNLL